LLAAGRWQLVANFSLAAAYVFLLCKQYKPFRGGGLLYTFYIVS